jgi:hypothetical protein
MRVSTVADDRAEHRQRKWSLWSRRQCELGRHRWGVVGYAPRGSAVSARVPCVRPLLARCDRCDEAEVWACGAHRESSCSPCASRYRYRVQAVAESGLGAAPAGYLYLVTLTAPGSRPHLIRPGRPCPCTPTGGVDLAAWNADHSRRWNIWVTRLRAEHAGCQYFRAVEVQRRGALHDHVILWSADRVSKAEVRALAIAGGWGHEVDVQRLEPGSRWVARYVAKYVSKACDSRTEVPWAGEVVEPATGEVLPGVVTARYRTWSMSARYGVRMAEVRRAAGDRARQLAEQGALAVLSAVFGPVWTDGEYLGGVEVAASPAADPVVARTGRSAAASAGGAAPAAVVVGLW